MRKHGEQASSVRLIEKITRALRESAQHNSDVQVAPHCILWPDRDRQWESVIQRLQEDIPELFVLGAWDQNKRSGPAIWLRCIIAKAIPGLSVGENKPVIVYLPGVSRQDLRAVESCPAELKPMAELQYRGTTWAQVANGKDWTVLAFFKSNQGGLGLDVAQDNETKNAMLLCLYRFLDEDIEMLSGRHLDKDYFNTLLTGRDPIRDLLQWLDQGDTYKSNLNKNAWTAFVAVCKSQLGFNPDNEGLLVGATKLANHEGPWDPVWERFCEAPKRYKNVPALIRRCAPPKDSLLWSVSDAKYDGWPQWNEEQENKLRTDLLSLSGAPPAKARNEIIAIEKRHSSRRKLVWAELGEAPLALGLAHLARLAGVTSTGIASGECADLCNGYVEHGWKADDAVLHALSEIDRDEDFKVVSGVIRAIYLPWLEDSARHLQKLVESKGYPGGSISTSTKVNRLQGECILFVDGLRFDTAKRLSEKLTNKNCNTSEQPCWAALPSVTATGKPAVSPVRERITGADANSDFEPVVVEGGQSLKGGYQIKKLLSDGGWEVLERSAYGAGKGNAWCEFGNIDSEGHERGWKLSKHIENLLVEIQDRVLQLLTNGGWRSVRIVTDHGWLLMPGGLPKIDLPAALAENKWGRCAAIKPGAKTKEKLFPWFWDPSQQFALADGISCFRKGEEYAHGGLSLQECLNLELTVTLASPIVAHETIEITDIGWKGLRCSIGVEGSHEGLQADLRKQPGDSTSSVVVSVKGFKINGTTSLVVDDENLEGSEAFVVLLDKNGAPMSQKITRIGGVKYDS